MQVVCEATQSQSEDVQVGAYQCLVRIMSLYYEKMSFYMERALFGVSPDEVMALMTQLTLTGMKSQNEKVALQAIEFWSTVCDEEIDLMAEAAEVSGLLDSELWKLTTGRIIWRDPRPRIVKLCP